MTDKEIVKALRDIDTCGECENMRPDGICSHDGCLLYKSMREGADAIERLTALIEARTEEREALKQDNALLNLNLERITAEVERLSLIKEEKDTLMKRRKEQIEVIRTRIDKGGLCDAEKRLLNDLNLPSDYDRRRQTHAERMPLPEAPLASKWRDAYNAAD